MLGGGSSSSGTEFCRAVAKAVTPRTEFRPYRAALCSLDKVESTNIHSKVILYGFIETINANLKAWKNSGKIKINCLDEKAELSSAP